MESLIDLKQELKKTIPNGIDIVLAQLEQLVKYSNVKINELILIMARYKETHKKRLLQEITSDEANAQLNNIRKSILSFIDNLNSSDINATQQSNQGGKRVKAKRGKVLYRIPKIMQIGRQEKCIVRVAFNKELLLEDLDVNDLDSIKSVRISKVMGANIIDPSENPPFTIRTISEEVQFIDNSDYTEWIFYVRPNKMGIFPLILKVTIIELINKKERSREIVLEEKIEIKSKSIPKEHGQKDEEVMAALPSILVLDSFNENTNLPGHNIITPNTSVGKGGINFQQFYKLVSLALILLFGWLFFLFNPVKNQNLDGFTEKNPIQELEKQTKKTIKDVSMPPFLSPQIPQISVSGNSRRIVNWDLKTLKTKSFFLDYIQRHKIDFNSNSFVNKDEPLSTIFADTNSLKLDNTLRNIKSYTPFGSSLLANSIDDGVIFLKPSAQQVSLDTKRDKFFKKGINVIKDGFITPNQRRIISVVKSNNSFLFVSERVELNEDKEEKIVIDSFYYDLFELTFWNSDGEMLKRELEVNNFFSIPSKKEFSSLHPDTLVKKNIDRKKMLERIEKAAIEKFGKSNALNELKIFLKNQKGKLPLNQTVIPDSILKTTHLRFEGFELKYFNDGEKILFCKDSNSASKADKWPKFRSADKPKLQYLEVVAFDSNGNRIKNPNKTPKDETLLNVLNDKNSKVLELKMDQLGILQLGLFDLNTELYTRIKSLDSRIYKSPYYNFLFDDEQILIEYSKKSKKERKEAEGSKRKLKKSQKNRRLKLKILTEIDCRNSVLIQIHIILENHRKIIFC